jgi:hypothetical protein
MLGTHAGIVRGYMTVMTNEALNQAKQAAHEAYLAAVRCLDLFDETADQVWIGHAVAAKEHAWKLYEVLVLKTEW